jgi:protein PhnA
LYWIGLSSRWRTAPQLFTIASLEIADAENPMSALPACPRCKSELTYQDGAMYICPECGHEWTGESAMESIENANVVRDANGNTLADGDDVMVVKDLKVKGAASTLKAGTKVKGIRLVEGDHNIDCRIEGFGGMKLKSEFVKKVPA